MSRLEKEYKSASEVKELFYSSQPKFKGTEYPSSEDWVASEMFCSVIWW